MRSLTMHDLDDLEAIQNDLSDQSKKLDRQEWFDLPSKGYNNTAQSDFKQNEKNHVEPIRKKRRTAQEIREAILRTMVECEEV